MIDGMSELRALPPALRLAPNTVAVAVGVLVAGTLLASMLWPEFGHYITQGIAMILALGAAGMGAYAAISPTDLGVTRMIRRPMTTLALIAFGAALIKLPFAVMAVSGDGLRGLGNTLARSVALRGGEYETVLARAVGFVLLVGALHLRRVGWSRLLLLAGAALVTGSFLLTGHARTHAPVIAVTLDAFAHLAAAAFWFGGLLALSWTLRRRRGDTVASGRLLAIFAHSMTVALTVLAAAGAGLAVLYLDSPSALLHTVYGQVLMVKLALVAIVLVLSSANHARLVPSARMGNTAAVRVLRTNIAAEQVLLVAVLAVTEVLMRQNPGG